MKIFATKALGLSALALLAIVPAVQAQGVVPGVERGTERGVTEGDRAAGPVGGAVGGVVGGAVGGVVGGVNGLLGVDQQPQFHDYVVRERRRSYHYAGHLKPGVVLPEEGYEYYDVPASFGLRGYRYTVIDGETVLVDPQTHEIVRIVR